MEKSNMNKEPCGGRSNSPRPGPHNFALKRRTSHENSMSFGKTKMVHQQNQRHLFAEIQSHQSNLELGPICFQIRRYQWGQRPVWRIYALQLSFLGGTHLLVIVIPFLFWQIDFWEWRPTHTYTFPDALGKRSSKDIIFIKSDPHSGIEVREFQSATFNH